MTGPAAQGVPVSGMIVPDTGMSIPDMGTKAANSLPGTVCLKFQNSSKDSAATRATGPTASTSRSRKFIVRE